MPDGRRVLEAIQRAGGIHKLPAAPDGPIIPEFHARQLARALEQEITRAGAMGWTKITLHMDLQDAMRLANHLRKGGP